VRTTLAQDAAEGTRQAERMQTAVLNTRVWSIETGIQRLLAGGGGTAPTDTTPASKDVVTTKADKRREPTGPNLDHDRQRVSLKGKWYDLTNEQTAVLSVLVQAKGAWVGGSNCGGSRPDKTIKGMPRPVRKIVQSHTRNGYRIPSLLPK